MTADSEINDIWKRTDTNEIDALVRQMQKAAEEADHEIDGGRPQQHREEPVFHAAFSFSFRY